MTPAIPDIAAKRIVVLDDNRNFQNMMRGMLRAFGFRNVDVLSEAAALVTLLEQNHVDLGFFDLVMTGSGGSRTAGIDAVKAVRWSKRIVNRTMPIVLVTGHASRPVVEAASLAGADHVLAKPISPQSLCSVITAMLAQPPRYVASEGDYFGPDLDVVRRRLKRAAAERRPAHQDDPASRPVEPRRAPSIPGLNVPIKDSDAAFLD